MMKYDYGEKTIAKKYDKHPRVRL